MSAAQPGLLLSARFAGRVLLGCILTTIALVVVVGTWLRAKASLYGSDLPHSGWSARGVPDQDDDGAAEFVLSTPFEPGALAGGRRRTFSSVAGVPVPGPPENLGGDKRVGPGDLDGDGLLDVAWSTSDGATIVTWPGLRLMPGRVDVNHDGHDDLLGVRNVRLTGAAEIPDDIWRRGRVEMISGRTLETLHTYGADALGRPQ